MPKLQVPLKQLAARREPSENGANKLAIVIVTYNSASVLLGLLDSLPAGLKGIDGYTVIVVDNASSDASVETALSHPLSPMIVEMGGNFGYAAGINAATAIIDPRADLLVLNPDIRLLPGAARFLVERLKDLSVGVTVPQMLDEEGGIARSLRREPSLLTVWGEALLGGTLAARVGASEIIAAPNRYELGGTVEWATGAALMISAKARHLVGTWDEFVFPLQRRG